MRKELTKPAITVLSQLFCVNEATLRLWNKTPNRSGHVEFLLAAHEAISSRPEYLKVLECPSGGGVQDNLGFKSPFSLEVDGIPSRTLRNWFDTPGKHRLAIGILLGYHWVLVKEIAHLAQYPTALAMLEHLESKALSSSEVVGLYLECRAATVKLLKRY